eukprot:UN28054
MVPKDTNSPFCLQKHFSPEKATILEKEIHFCFHKLFDISLKILKARFIFSTLSCGQLFTRLLLSETSRSCGKTFPRNLKKANGTIYNFEVHLSSPCLRPY